MNQCYTRLLSVSVFVFQITSQNIKKVIFLKILKKWIYFINAYFTYLVFKTWWNIYAFCASF